MFEEWAHHEYATRDLTTLEADQRRLTASNRCSMLATMRSGAALDSLGELAERVRPVTLTREQRLPVLPAFEGLLPGAGLRRGATVSIGSAAGVGGATSLALALVAEASRTGSWVAAVGLPSLGLVAADELGVALERLVLVAAPERDAWGGVVAALVDGFDLVILHAGRTGVRTADARRLVARAGSGGRCCCSSGRAGPREPTSSSRSPTAGGRGSTTVTATCRRARCGSPAAAGARRPSPAAPTSGCPACGRVGVEPVEPVECRCAPVRAACAAVG